LTIDSPESAVKRITSAPKRLAPRYRKTRRFNPIWKRYKSDLKSKNSVEKLTSELLRSYEKDKARGKADSIQERLAKCGITSPPPKYARRGTSKTS
jgi:hypothetical protein